MATDDDRGDLGIDVYVGAPDEPQPDWRKVLTEDDTDDDVPPSADELEAMSAIAGVDYGALDWDGEGDEAEPAAD